MPPERRRSTLRWEALGPLLGQVRGVLVTGIHPDRCNIAHMATTVHSGLLDAVQVATATLNSHGLPGTGGPGHIYPTPVEGVLCTRHPTEAALDPLRRTGPVPVICGPCGTRLGWAALPTIGTTVHFGRRVKAPNRRTGDESDLIDGLGRGPMFDNAARAHTTLDRWRFACPCCHATYPLRRDTALLLYLRAVAKAELSSNRPELVLGVNTTRSRLT